MIRLPRLVRIPPPPADEAQPAVSDGGAPTPLAKRTRPPRPPLRMLAILLGSTLAGYFVLIPIIVLTPFAIWVDRSLCPDPCLGGDSRGYLLWPVAAGWVLGLGVTLPLILVAVLSPGLRCRTWPATARIVWGPGLIVFVVVSLGWIVAALGT